MDAKLGGILAKLAYTPNGQTNIDVTIPPGWQDAGGFGYGDSTGGAFQN